MDKAVFIVRTAFFAAGAVLVITTLSAAGWYDVPLPFGWSASQGRWPALCICVLTAPILLTFVFPTPGKAEMWREDEVS